VRPAEQIIRELFDCQEHLRRLEILDTPVEHEDRYRAFFEKAIVTKRVEQLTKELDEALE
jgi:hypothetical protein